MHRRDFLKSAAALGALATSRGFALTPAPSTRPLSRGDWPMYRHDGRMIGYQPLAGAMGQAPQVVAKHFLGASAGARTMADLHGSGHAQDSLVVARGKLFAFDRDGKPLWTSEAPGYDVTDVKWIDDLDGDGRHEIVVQAGHIGGTRLAYVILDSQTGKKLAAIDFITGDFGFTGLCGAYVAGAKGKQIFLVTSDRQSEQGWPPTQTGEFSLWTFDGKAAKRAWSYVPTEFVIYYPAVMVAELAPRSPGKFFGVVDSWCHVWSIDLATGHVVSHENWDTHSASPRQYGWNELVDVDGDGALDFVNVSMTKHVDVLRNDGTGKLKLAWSHGWTDVITTEKRALRPISNGILDVDGDGKKEVIAALFDGIGDNRWHLFVWDAVDGKEKATALDLVPLATVALWGEGKPRAILCARSSTQQYDPPPQLEAWVMRDGALKQAWVAPGKVKLQGTPPKNSERRVCEYNATDLIDPTTITTPDGRLAFVTADWDGKNPRAWGLSDGGEIVEKPMPPAPATGPGGPKLPDLQGTTVPYLLAADVDADGRNEVLLYDNANVTVLKFDGHALRPVKTIPSTEVPIVCDLLGDGRPVLLTGGREASRDLYVRATRWDGTVVWNYVFPTSEACGQYSERPHYFTVGHFTGGPPLDVFTWSMKPEARAYVLDGRTGHVVYRKDEVPHIDRSFQGFGGRVGVWDSNGDGCDDLLFTNPDYYCLASGKTGDLLVGPVELNALVKWWAAYATPVVLTPADPKEKPFVYLGGAYSSRCAISADGKRCLFREYLSTERWPLLSGPQRFTEGLLPPSTVSAKWRVGDIEADGTLRLFEADTGKHLWATNLSTDAGVIVSGDVDGDGEPELLLGGKDGCLYCIRDGGSSPEVVWKRQFDAPIACVVLADVDEDGKSEIVASVADGNVYVLDAKAPV
jgi:hypothetical protein